MSSRPMTGTSADAAPYWAEARHALGRADPILGNLIRAAGGSVLRSRNDPFFSLSRSIVAQQISVHAAEAVWQKLIAHVGAMTPGAVASQTEDALHGCGLSRPKARYLLSLAEHFTEGALDQEWRCCTARSKSLTFLCRLQSHPAQYVSGIPSAAILLSISHPIRCSTRCLANVRVRISGPMIAL